jgi:hypothetical protein
VVEQVAAGLQLPVRLQAVHHQVAVRRLVPVVQALALVERRVLRLLRVIALHVTKTITTAISAKLGQQAGALT